ncbi:MAG: zincin-like metallopeptidase domain-containing protein [Desulfobulbus sp.]
MKKSERKSVAETFTESIVEELQKGTAPWQKPWKAGEFHRPMNPISGTTYRGVNTIMLARHGFADPRWLTFKQANEQEWRVKKGSKAQQVVFWQWTDRQTVLDESGHPVMDENGEEKKENVQLERPRLHVFSVFNASQLQTLDGQDIPPYEEPELTWDPLQKGEEILTGSGATISHDQADRAFYRISTDDIHLPPKENFPEAGDYYSTALHELGHWTGHPSRMDREFGPFGSEVYAKEELRAEIASWMLSQELGLPHQPNQHVSYVENWVSVLKKDPQEIMRACRDAEKIKEYVMNLEHEMAVQQTEKEAGVFIISGASPEVYQEYETAQEAGSAYRVMCATHRQGPLHCEYQDDTNIYILASQDHNFADQTKFTLKFEGLEYPPPKEMKESFMAGYDRSDKLLEQNTAVQESSLMAETKTYLNVPYKEKNKAKKAGAKWDSEVKRWYAPEGTDLVPLSTWLPEKETVNSIPSMPPTQEFSHMLREAGLIVEEPILDGGIHRVPVESGKPGAKDGAYCGYEDGRPNGWGQNYKTGEHVKWVATRHVLTEQEKETLQAEAQVRKAEREQQIHEQRVKAKKRAYAKWMNAEPSNEHIYLRNKGVEGYGLKQDNRGNLLIPGFDLRTGHIQTLQWIEPNGAKRFESGCPQHGAALVIPSPEHLDDGEILLAEGYATAASIHMATGQTVVAAFTAHNLQPVGEILREQYPDAEITICADNDHHLVEQINGTPIGNVGLKKAKEAAAAIGATVAVPKFNSEEILRRYTDFNDLHKSRGLEAVAKQVNGQVVEVER